jgi:hypothetical protein
MAEPSVNHGIQTIGGGSITVIKSNVGPNGAVVNHGNVTTFSSELAQLAGDPRVDDQLAAVLRWIDEHHGDATPPADAPAKLLPLRRAGAWLWERLTRIIDASPIPAAWLVALIHTIHMTA